MTRGLGHLGGAGLPFPQGVGPLGSPSGTRPFLLHPREEGRPPRMDPSRSLLWAWETILLFILTLDQGYSLYHAQILLSDAK